MARKLWTIALVLSLLIGLYFGWAWHRARDMSPFYGLRVQLPAFPYPDRWVQDLFLWFVSRQPPAPPGTVYIDWNSEEWHTRDLLGAGTGAFLCVFVAGVLIRIQAGRSGSAVADLLGLERRLPSHCSQCGYDLAPSLAAWHTTCPECGRAFDPDSILAADPVTRAWWKSFLGIAGLVACGYWLALLFLLVPQLLSLQRIGPVESVWLALLWPLHSPDEQPVAFRGLWSTLLTISLGWGAVFSGVLTLWRQRWPILTAVWERFRPPSTRS